MQELGSLLGGNIQKTLRAERINQKLHAAPFGGRHGALVELAEQMVAKGRAIGERDVFVFRSFGWCAVSRKGK